jgi:hypothetical protein
VTKMHTCAHCSRPTEKLKCAKCRSVVYCNSYCQKADWDEHKTTCQPCLIYVSEQVTALYKTEQWRKLLSRWSTYLNALVEVADEDGKRLLLTMFKEANQMGANTTNASVYANAAIPILLKLIDLDGKQELFETQGLELCELGQSYSFDSNDQLEMECYLRACEIGEFYGIASVKCVGNFAIGRIFIRENRLVEAKPLLRIALEAAESEDTYGMKQQAVMCCDELCNILFNLDAIDEVGPLVVRFQKLLKKSMAPGSASLQQFHMRGFILLARFFEATHRPEEAVSEIYKMISLIDANKHVIHEWRPLFLYFLDHAFKNLRILHHTDIGDFQLTHKVYLLRDEQRRKEARS